MRFTRRGAATAAAGMAAAGPRALSNVGHFLSESAQKEHYAAQRGALNQVPMPDDPVPAWARREERKLHREQQRLHHRRNLRDRAAQALALGSFPHITALRATSAVFKLHLAEQELLAQERESHSHTKTIGRLIEQFLPGYASDMLGHGWEEEEEK